MRVPKLRFSMRKSAVRGKSAVALIEELALYCFVVTVRLAVKELLLLAHFIHIHSWQRLNDISYNFY